MSKINSETLTVSSTNLTSLSRSQLATLLQEQQQKNGELSEDLLQIGILLTRFLQENPLPNKVNVFWVLTRVGAVVKLIKDIVGVLKTKGHVSQTL